MKVPHHIKGARTGGVWALSCLALTLCAYTPQSRAKCALGPGIAENLIYISMGNIVVPPGSVKGPTLIAERKYPISHKDATLLVCTEAKDHGRASGRLHMGTNEVGSESIYETNIPGIGIRIGLRPRDSSGTFRFPTHWKRDGVGVNTTIGRQGWIHVELFKFKNRPGNGPLQEGLYATLSEDTTRETALRVMVSGRATTIISPSCDPPKLTEVQLGKVWKNQFSSVGSTAAEQRFSIKLTCWKVGPELHSVYLSMDAKADASGAPGVIALTSNTNAATGVGIQILDKDRQPVAYGQSALVGVSKDGVYDVPFHARYYQTASQVTAGVANGTATFTLEYK